MANSIFSSVQEFIETVGKNKTFYKSSEYRLLILKVDERWTIISGAVRLSFHDRRSYGRNLFSLNNRLQVKHKIEKFDLDKLSNFINGLNSCNFSFSNKEIFFSEHKDPILKNEENANWNVFGLKDLEGWPAQILYFPSKFLSDILPDDRDITDDVRIQQPRGFSSLGELSNELIGFTIVPASATRVYVVAPIYEKLDKIMLTSNGILTAAFLCHESLSTDHPRISVLYYSDSRKVDNFHISIPPILIQERSKFKIYDVNKRRKVMGITSADLFLIHENKIIQRYHVKASTNLIPAKGIIQAPTRPVSISATAILKNALGKEESKDLEFKSSMLHDKGKSQKSKFLPLELIKAIVSFLNTEGGDVFVGIDPDRKIVGIEQDFQYLGKNKNFDGWTQCLSNLIGKHLNEISFSSITLEGIPDDKTGLTVARITMKRHFRPTFIKYDDNGQHKQEFYIRGLNGKRLLSPEETYQYIVNLWPSKQHTLSTL